VMSEVTSPEQQALARQARQILATYRNAEDLISVGAYQSGSDARIDRARQIEPALQAYLAQPRGEVTRLEDGFERLRGVLQGGGS
ncbi:MAG TPA: flagellum-specific ATP synthase FliI, partial [Myxococcota bacterium]|nr:flagellum-specific ATP synthase FliI [Myxococcota bacterium]